MAKIWAIAIASVTGLALTGLTIYKFIQNSELNTTDNPGEDNATDNSDSGDNSNTGGLENPLDQADVWQWNPDIEAPPQLIFNDGDNGECRNKVQQYWDDASWMWRIQ